MADYLDEQLGYVGKPKLVGKVDVIGAPNLGMEVKKGDNLFTVRSEGRTIQFKSPISGKVVKINDRRSKQ